MLVLSLIQAFSPFLLGANPFHCMLQEGRLPIHVAASALHPFVIEIIESLLEHVLVKHQLG